MANGRLQWEMNSPGTHPTLVNIRFTLDRHIPESGNTQFIDIDAMGASIQNFFRD